MCSKFKYCKWSSKLLQRADIIVIALGGNALIREDENGSYEKQFHNIQVAINGIVDIIEEGYSVVLTHGNGPQVGAALLRHKIAEHIYPAFPLHACNAETQGLIGYMIEHALQDELNTRKLDKCVTTLITRVLVNSEDPAFQNPTKPIGKIFYDKRMIDLTFDKDSDSNVSLRLVTKENQAPEAGYRIVVPSPKPISILEHKAIRTLINAGFVVIACGGGGIPMIRRNGVTAGIDAVIDKDLAAERLATLIGARKLLLLTNVDGVFENYGTEKQFLIPVIKVDRMNTLDLGKFGEGSMAPKIQASLEFIKNGGKEAIIGHLNRLLDSVAGLSGTHFIP
jgi:carbamate kinase